MKNIQLYNAISRPSHSNTLYFTYYENSGFITEGEAIEYDSVDIEDYKKLPHHIKNFFIKNTDTQNTKVCIINNYYFKYEK